MGIKKQIRITYLVELDTDYIEQRIEGGTATIKDIQIELKTHGIKGFHTGLLSDYEVESVENIEEAK
jgi:hypothetical protein